MRELSVLPRLGRFTRPSGSIRAWENPFEIVQVDTAILPGGLVSLVRYLAGYGFGAMLAHSALQTSEKAANLVAKRPEREFSLRAATFQISAEAARRDSTW